MGRNTPPSGDPEMAKLKDDEVISPIIPLKPGTQTVSDTLTSRLLIPPSSASSTPSVKPTPAITICTTPKPVHNTDNNGPKCSDSNPASNSNTPASNVEISESTSSNTSQSYCQCPNSINNNDTGPPCTPPIQPPTLEELVANCFLYANDYSFTDVPMQVQYIKTFQLLISKYHAEENLNFLIEIYKYEYLYLNYQQEQAQQTQSNTDEGSDDELDNTELNLDPNSPKSDSSPTDSNQLSTSLKLPVLNTSSSSSISLLVRKSKAPSMSISRTVSHKLDIFPFSDEESLINMDLFEHLDTTGENSNGPALTPAEALSSVWDKFRSSELDNSSEQGSELSKSIQGNESLASCSVIRAPTNPVDVVDTVSINSATSFSKGTKWFAFDERSIIQQWNFIISSYISPFSSQQINLLQRASDFLLSLNKTSMHDPILLLDAKKEIMRLLKENIYIKFIRTLRKEYNLRVASPTMVTPVTRSPLFHAANTSFMADSETSQSINATAETQLQLQLQPGSTIPTPLQLPSGALTPSIHNSMASYAIHNSSSIHHNNTTGVQDSGSNNNNKASSLAIRGHQSVATNLASPSPISPAASNANSRLINSPDLIMLRLPGDSPISLTPVISKDFQAGTCSSPSSKPPASSNSPVPTRTSTATSTTTNGLSPVTSPMNLKRLASNSRRMKKFIPGLHQSSTSMNSTTGSSSSTGGTSGVETHSTTPSTLDRSIHNSKTSTGTGSGSCSRPQNRAAISSTPTQGGQNSPVLVNSPNTSMGNSLTSIWNHLRITTQSPPSSPSIGPKIKGPSLNQSQHRSHKTIDNEIVSPKCKLPLVNNSDDCSSTPMSPQTPCTPSDHGILSGTGIKHLFRKREKH